MAPSGGNQWRYLQPAPLDFYLNKNAAGPLTVYKDERAATSLIG